MASRRARRRLAQVRDARRVDGVCGRRPARARLRAGVVRGSCVQRDAAPRMSRTPAQRKRDRDAFLEVGIWLLFFALLVPAGFVGYAIGRSTSHAQTSVRARGAHGAVAAPAQTPWSLQNGDLFNTRRTRHSSITSATVSTLGVAWTMPLNAGSIYGTFAANPVSDRNGVAYLQDLDSNVSAVDLASGRVLWPRIYNSQDIGPNGVSVAGGT